MSKIFNNALFEAKERESAVSPVVGVMLMLVVTIIIAATVSAFAGGLVGTSEKAPTAAFDVKIELAHVLDHTYMDSEYDTRIMTISHLGGDPIDTSRMKIITTWTNKTTNEINYRETTALPTSETEQEYKPGKYVKLDLLNANVNYSTKYQEPYFVIPGVMPGNDVSIWFGNFILHPGENMKVDASLADYNTDGYEEHSIIKNAKLLSGKDSVNVKFIDIPTGNIIFNKDVYVVSSDLKEYF